MAKVENYMGNGAAEFLEIGQNMMRSVMFLVVLCGNLHAQAPTEMLKDYDSGLSSLRKKAIAAQGVIVQRFKEEAAKLRAKLLDEIEAARVKAMEEDRLDDALSMRELAEAYANASPNLVQDPTTSVEVPIAAQEFNGHSYLVVSQSMTWRIAAKNAENLGGHLATIDSQAELDFVTALCGQAGAVGLGTYWIDGNDEGQEGAWVDSRGAPLRFTQWGPNQPDNAHGWEHNLAMAYDHDRGRFEFGDVDAGRRWWSIIEWDSDLPVQTRNKRVTKAGRHEHLRLCTEEILGEFQSERPPSNWSVVANHRGRTCVLRTHPVGTPTNHIPTTFAWTGRVPDKGKPHLLVSVSSEKNFRLILRIDGKVVTDRVIGMKPSWHDLRFDLSVYAGKRVKIEVANAANDWDHEHAYWDRLEIVK